MSGDYLQESLVDYASTDTSSIQIVKIGVPDDHKTSAFGAYFSLVCGTLGAGMLSLPNALQSSGWVGGIIIALSGIFAYYTAGLLSKCLDAPNLLDGEARVLNNGFQDFDEGKIDDYGGIDNFHVDIQTEGEDDEPMQEILTYGDLGEYVFGPYMRKLVMALQCLTLFGVCTIFLILIGQNMHMLVEDLTLHVWVIIFGCCLIPVTWLKTLKEVSWLAAFGMFASLGVGVLVVTKGWLRYDDSAAASMKHKWFHLGGIPLCFNIICFSFGGHSLIPTIKGHMKNPARFGRVCAGAYTTLTLVYGAVALGGYAGWGDAVADNVLLSMDNTHAIVKFAYGIITAHIMLAYPIPMNPLNIYLERAVGITDMEPEREVYWRVGFRTLIVLATIFVASVVPYFGDVLSLVSALSIIGVVYVFPVIFYYWLYKDVNELHPCYMQWYKKAYMLLILTIGVVGSGVGIYYGVKDLADDIKDNPSPFDHFWRN